MKTFIQDHPGAFLIGVVFAVTALAGAGALAIAAGAPLALTLAVELGLYVLFALGVSIFVTRPEGAATSLALVTALPFLAFFGWLESRVAPESAAAMVLFGVAGVIASALAPRFRGRVQAR